MDMKLSAKEIVEQLTDDIENHPDRYPTWNSVFDKLFHSIHENYSVESDMKIYPCGVNNTGLPDKFIADYFAWKMDNEPRLFAEKGSIMDISPYIYIDHITNRWVIRFHVEFLSVI